MRKLVETPARSAAAQFVVLALGLSLIVPLVVEGLSQPLWTTRAYPFVPVTPQLTIPDGFDIRLDGELFINGRPFAIEEAGFMLQAGPPTDRDAKAYEAITVADSVVGFTAAAAGATYRWAYVTIETANIRYRYDGGNPSTTVGHLGASGTSFWVPGPNNVVRFKAIRTTGTSATIHVTQH